MSLLVRAGERLIPAFIVAVAMVCWAAAEQKTLQDVLREGKEALAIGKYGTAVEIAGQLKRLAPDEDEVIRYRGALVDALVQKFEWNVKAARWDEAQMGKSLIAELDPDRAQRLVMGPKVVAERSKSQVVRAGLVRVMDLREAGQHEEALAECMRVLKEAPDNEELQLLRNGLVSHFLSKARAAEEKGDIAEATRHCGVVYSLLPHPEAIEILARLKVAGDEAKAWTACGKSLEGGNWEAARDDLRGYLTSFRGGAWAAEARFRLGFVYEKMREVRAAVDAWGRVVDEYPGSSWAAEADKKIAELSGISRIASLSSTRTSRADQFGVSQPVKTSSTEDLWK